MKRDGLENVHTEPVMVPRWVRGRESAEIVEPARHPIAMLGLGDSVGTPAQGIQADVLVVHSFDELDANASSAASGRIVVFNVAVHRPTATRGRSDSNGAVARRAPRRRRRAGPLDRAGGPAAAPHRRPELRGRRARRFPRRPSPAKTPTACSAWPTAASASSIRLQMEAHFEPDADSANVVGELRGRERPDEVVVVGGHLDSWDVGAGASDDGGGCIVTWEALRLMKKLGLRPRRTVRVVLFTNEENGTRGGRAYRDAHRAELAKHVMMLESDIGLFPPVGVRVHRQRARARKRCARLRRC